MPDRSVLTINTGSSSLKAALSDAGDPAIRRLTVLVEHIGHATTVRVSDRTGTAVEDAPLPPGDHSGAVAALLSWLDRAGEIASVTAVGHRVVHGGRTYAQPARIDEPMLATLRRLVPFAPNHLPQAIDAIEAMRAALPDLPQVACFDTAFHRTMPPVAQRYPLPPEFERDGVIRYGFHGLSYASIVEQLGARLAQRTIVAHLGNGASMAALRDGMSVDTTMGFTPLGGLMMGTRPGDLDPGVLLYLLQQTGLTVDEIGDLVTNRAGLRGVSGITADMKTLLERAPGDTRAEHALDLYVYLARKQLGAMIAVLGGVDLLVFTGGIGEHGSEIRERIGQGFGFAGIEIDPAANRQHATIISYPGSAVQVMVLPSDEERIIARETIRLIDHEGAS